MMNEEYYLLLIAYLGPGLGAGTLAVILGFLLCIVLAVFGVLWYPIKRLIKTFKKKPSDDEEA